MNKTVFATIIIILFLITSNLSFNTAAETIQNDYLKIDVESKTVELDINQKGTTIITITNIWNESLGIYLEWIFIECGDLTHGKFSENFFYLAPNENKEVNLYLSGSKISFPNGCEDGIIDISWGTRLNVTSWGSLDWDTKDGDINIGIDVIRNMTFPIIVYGIIPGVIIALIIILFLGKRKKKKRSQTTRSEQEGE